MHRGAGAYICGEETGLFSSLEGGRGEPRNKPPFPAVAGLYGMPTVVNNVETLCNVPFIVERGADWFLSIGTEKSPGTKLFSVSGMVRRPGNYELPLGITMRELIYDVAGGMLPGPHAQGGAARRRQLAGASARASRPAAGLSTRCSRPVRSSAPRASWCLTRPSAWCGTALYYADFFSHESCGQCTPCREGDGVDGQAVAQDRARPRHAWRTSKSSRAWTRHVRHDHLSALGLLQDVLESVLKHFPEEFEAHVQGRACLAEQPQEVRSA